MIALDLANTVATTRTPDALGDPFRAAAWIAGHGAEGPPRIEGDVSSTRAPVAGVLLASPAWARRLQTEALLLRGDIQTLLDAVVTDLPLATLPLPTLERALAAGRWTRRLDRSDGVLRLTEASAPTERPLAVLAPFAASAARLVETVQPARLRRCDAQDCLRWFVDTSRGGRRRWCSMATCGNRRKAARHRKRHPAGP